MGSGADVLHSYPSFAAHVLCDSRKVTSPFWASISLQVEGRFLPHRSVVRRKEINMSAQEELALVITV